MGFIPYSRQLIEEDDIRAVAEVLRSDWLTTGPTVERFEKALCEFCHADHAVAVSNGTAALHIAMASLGLGPGDQVIVPAITFVATSNAVLFTGARPVFADVCEDDLTIDPVHVESLITDRTKAIIAVDYAGKPCDYDSLKSIAGRHGLVLISDACHSLGAKYKNQPVGSIADITVFSFHPVKPITTGEGGAVVFKDEMLARRARRLRNHGIDMDFRQRSTNATWEYDVVELGYNYRITDIQCALGLSQLKKLSGWVHKRNEIAEIYRDAFRQSLFIEPLKKNPFCRHAYHLFVVKLPDPIHRDRLFHSFRKNGIGVNVHYRPVYLHTFYKTVLGTGPGLCHRAETAYERILSLPIFPAMTDDQVELVIEKALTYEKRA